RPDVMPPTMSSTHSMSKNERERRAARRPGAVSSSAFPWPSAVSPLPASTPESWPAVPGSSSGSSESAFRSSSACSAVIVPFSCIERTLSAADLFIALASLLLSLEEPHCILVADLPGLQPFQDFLRRGLLQRDLVAFRRAVFMRRPLEPGA